MKVKSHIALKIASMIAGFILGGLLLMMSIDTLEVAGYPLDLVFFIAINAFWIIPNLFFKFIMVPKCPNCGSKGKYVWHFHPRPAEFVCKQCDYREQTLWTLGTEVFVKDKSEK